MPAFNVEWIYGFALGADYLSQIDVSDGDGVVDVVRLQLGIICIYFPVS
tara:strand:- start:1737 stop:1883 length:147 start_codon:yes stop_codon:yes gene_type:complete